jgi:hypothetical protein
MSFPPASSVSFKCVIAVIIAVAAATAGVRAQSADPIVGKLSLNQLTDRAASIVVGTVVSRQAEWEYYGASKLIITKVTMAIEQSVKGSVPRTLVLEVLGGTIGDQTMQVSDVPEFRVGDRDVLFLHNNPHAVSPLVGSDQGLFRVVNESANGVPRILTAGYAVVQPASAVRPAGTLPTLGSAFSLDEFVNVIRDRVRAQGRR